MDPIDIRFVKFVEAVEKAGLDMKSSQVQEILRGILNPNSSTDVANLETLPERTVKKSFKQRDPVWLYHLGKPTTGLFLVMYCEKSAVVDLVGHGETRVLIELLNYGYPTESGYAVYL